MIGCDIMARAQQKKHKSKQKSKNYQKQDKPAMMSATKKVKEVSARHREPSKQEMMFFRIGISIIALLVVTVSIVFAIRYFMEDTEEEGPANQFEHVTAADLENIFMIDELNTTPYVNEEYFQGKDILQKLLNNTVYYVFVYRSSLIEDTSYLALIESIPNLDSLPFFLIDLDRDPDIRTNEKLQHLGMTETHDFQLIIFDMQNLNEDGSHFTVWTRERDITIDLEKLTILEDE
jgi:hypothetical protein